MKRLLLLLFILVFSFSVFAAIPAEAKQTPKTNWQIVKELCKKEGYSKIKLLKANEITDKKFWKIVDHRKGKNYIVVEKVISVSDGTDHGWYSTKTKGTNYIIGYNKRIPKGKKVISYVIWSPYSNECDEILYVVDNQRVRS